MPVRSRVPALEPGRAQVVFPVRRPSAQEAASVEVQVPVAWGAGGAGFLNSSQSNPTLNKALQANANKYTWAAATVNSNNASGYQLASGEPVMAIGGFNGTDPAPTLVQFEKYVSEGKIHYFIASGGGFGGAASAAASVAERVAEPPTTPARSRHGSRHTSPPRHWAA